MDPQLRPTAAEWVLLLRHLHGQVVPCNRTPQHHHPKGKPCPWCAVERSIGQPICRFPNTASPAPVAAAISTSNHWDELDHALRDAFRCHHQRAVELLARREAIGQQLLESNQQLQALLNRHGGSGHWLNQAQLQRHRNSWRARLRGWFGEGGGGEIRRNAAEQLIQLANANSDLVHEHYRKLQQQRKDLQRQLSALDLSPLLKLTASADPTAVAETRLCEAASLRRDRWLREQLSREPLRSWQIEGFGEARLRLLESHGLFQGEQLRANIDRLRALPGIGAGLQQRLRVHLQGVVRRLETSAGAAGIGPQREDLVLLPELLALQNGEQQLQTISRAIVSLTGAIQGLQATIRERRSAMQAQLEAFETLC
jgi:hypothetical protein